MKKPLNSGALTSGVGVDQPIKRSSEVWQMLGAVKTEFRKLGDVLAQTKLTLERAARNIEGAEAAQLMLGTEAGDQDT